MPAKLTTQEFIKKAREVHGEKYDYDLVDYQSSHSSIFIQCYKHGVFEQTPTNHLKGRGCPSCYGNKKHTVYSFLILAREIHGDKIYDYSFVKYVNNHSKVKIFCLQHGLFEQTPNSHLSGVGCPHCAYKKKAELQRYTTESFINCATKIHNVKTYDYSQVNYVNNKSKVKIVCPEHGLFEQTPNDHLKGVGCPGCAKSGFDRTKIGFLYILRSDCGQYMKIGITNKPDQRNAQLSRATPFSFKRIELIEGPGDRIANLEKDLLADYQPAEFAENFDGYSEWRLWDESIRWCLV